jgi:hypothetical protein
MMYIKLGADMYWDGKRFQPDHRKAIVFGSMMASARDLRAAMRIDHNCKITSLSIDHWNEYTG